MSSDITKPVLRSSDGFAEQCYNCLLAIAYYVDTATPGATAAPIKNGAPFNELPDPTKEGLNNLYLDLYALRGFAEGNKIEFSRGQIKAPRKSSMWVQMAYDRGDIQPPGEKGAVERMYVYADRLENLKAFIQKAMPVEGDREATVRQFCQHLDRFCEWLFIDQGYMKPRIYK